jgi:hypothetical protein
MDDKQNENSGPQRAPIYKRYTYPDGRIVEMTKDEFARLVDYFQTLLTWKRRLQRAGEWPLDKPAPEDTK